MVAIVKMTHDEETRAYVARRREEGKTDREIRRCIKRYIARHVYRTLNAQHRTHTAYFGVGSATYIGDHHRENWEAQVLRLSSKSVAFPLKNSSTQKTTCGPSGDEVFSLISMQKPQFGCNISP